MSVQAQGADMAASGIGAAVAVATLLALGGCGASAGNTTCGEYARMDFEDQTSEIRSLLSAHDLLADDTGNIRNLKRAVARHCGGNSTFVERTSNPDGKLDDATDWCKSSWRQEMSSRIDCDY
jgi:hypothetical protein